MGKGIGIDHPGSCDDLSACCLEGKICLHVYTKWLGHPLVHVLLRVEARHNPRWHATKVVADFWLEVEEAYKARYKAITVITVGALGLMIANSQGAEKFLCPTWTHCLKRDLRHMGVVEYVEYQDPHAHDFPL